MHVVHLEVSLFVLQIKKLEIASPRLLMRLVYYLLTTMVDLQQNSKTEQQYLKC